METEPQDLPMDSRDALRLASLLGEEFALPMLIETGISASAFDPLFDQGLLLQEGNTQARFATESLLKSVRDNTPWSQKRRSSLALAETLERHRGDAGLIGELYLTAQNYPKARSYFVRSAESRCLKNEYGEALALLRQAFEVWPPDEDADTRLRVLKEMARCAGNTGEHGAAQIVWEELLESSETKGDLALQVEANRQLADLATNRGDRLEMKQRLKRAAELCSQLGDPAEEAKQWRVYAQFLLDYVRLSEAISACEKSIQAAEKAKDYGIVSEVTAISALAHAMSGKAEEGGSLVEEAIRIAIEHDLPDKLAVAYRRKANVNEYSCNYSGYLELEMESLDRCRTKGDKSMEEACLSCLAYAFFRLGRWKQSLDSLRAAIDELKVEGELLAMATSVRASIAAFRGERKQAYSNSEEALRLIGLHGGIVLEFYVHWSKGFLAMIDGEADRAREAFRDLISLWRETEDRKDCVPGILTAAMFYTDQNDGASLSECIDILNTVSADNQALEMRAARDAALAEGAWLRGRVDEAVGFASSALAAYEKQGLPPETALVTRRLGLMYASKGDLKAADDCWNKAGEIARVLGMRPLLDVLEKDRKAAGFETANKEAASLTGLTKRQIDVLRLIAQGDTNKEAAAKLNLSPRTVEMHVASVLERLNCRGRAEAVKKAAELGIV